MPVKAPPVSAFPTAVVILEVGLRDGLQSIATILPTADKCAWIDAAFAAGLREIEVGSFVPPRLLPQLADTAAVLAHARTMPGLFASVLVPNLQGAQRAIEVGISTAFGCTLQGDVPPADVLRLLADVLAALAPTPR